VPDSVSLSLRYHLQVEKRDQLLNQAEFDHVWQTSCSFGVASEPGSLIVIPLTGAPPCGRRAGGSKLSLIARSRSAKLIGVFYIPKIYYKII
ncbi:hypothetical protein Tco_1207607, partial [Tanacetum coccineum]